MALGPVVNRRQNRHSWTCLPGAACSFQGDAQNHMEKAGPALGAASPEGQAWGR